jgi:hypothetical protein
MINVVVIIIFPLIYSSAYVVLKLKILVISLVELLRQGTWPIKDLPKQGNIITQEIWTYIHAPSRIRTHDSSAPAAEECMHLTVPENSTR